jgi:phosphoribosylaminoimidazole-succinocarboxamide synthase
MSSTPVTQSALPLPIVRRGKVREVYGVDDETLLLVASDRISAFDVVMVEGIPRKGAVLTQMSAYWFRRLAPVTASHFLTADTDEIVARVPALESGSAWKEYRQSGTLAGEPLLQGLVESARLEPAIFSPATKAESGHDENITFARMQQELGPELAERLKDLSLRLYGTAAAESIERGIIIADTKFEFGHTDDGELLVIDEVLTPDSSRFWPVDQYQEGRGQPSFDKQPLRDFLDQFRQRGEWDGNPPPPPLPGDVIQATSIRYQDAYHRITGEELPEDL